MSKSREVYVAHCANDEQFHTPYDWWQAAWNAAMKNAAEICRNRIGPLDTTFDIEARACAEAIEQEQCK